MNLIIITITMIFKINEEISCKNMQYVYIFHVRILLFRLNSNTLKDRYYPMLSFCVFSLTVFEDIFYYHGIDIICRSTKLYNYEESYTLIHVMYAMRRQNSCVTFQSIGNDMKFCEYTLNYVHTQGYTTRSDQYYSTAMKINYFTYVKSHSFEQRRDTLRCKEDENFGVLVKTTEPEISFTRFYDNESSIEDSIRYVVKQPCRTQFYIYIFFKYAMY